MKKNLVKNLKIAASALVSAAMLMSLSGCGQTESTSGQDSSQETGDDKTENALAITDGEIPDIDLSAYDISQSRLGTVNEDGLREITAIADLTPHSELLEYVEPALEQIGLKVVLVATAADSTTLEKTQNGEIDFNFYGHWPYVNDQNETNGFTIVNAGDIHVEPIRAYSDKYTSVDEISDGDVVAIPNDATNEYRALKILEEQGLITLDDSVDSTLSATVDSIVSYEKNIEIVELDSAQIIPTKDDFDFFITNTNKALEAGITSNVLFSESGENNPFANIIAVVAGNEDDPAIQAVVAALRSDAVREYIEEKYNGAVIPAE